MLIFHARKQSFVEAPPEAVFAVVGDLSRHPELAGSGEVLSLRQTTEGPVGVGTQFESDKNIAFGPTRMKFVATSEVVAYDPPREISWLSQPPASGGPRMRRIQWWFRITPEGTGSRVLHEIQVEPASLVVSLLFGLPYRILRGRPVSRGMAETLSRLRRMAEEKAAWLS